MKKTRLAIFDIDGTVFRSSLLIELFNELVRCGVFPKKASTEVEKNFVAWLDRKGHYNDYLVQLVRVFYRYQKGCTVQEVAPAVKRVINWQMDRVYRFTRNLVGQLKHEGYFLLAISNSQESMVKGFANRLGFDAAIGRSLEIKDRKYTGRVIVGGKIFPIDSHIDKPGLLADFIAEHEMSVDLKNSIAIGDSEGDIPLLSIVGKPIAFNPSLPLARHARKHHWRIVVERKDVIYDIKNAEFVPHDEQQRVRVPFGKHR